MYFTPSLRLNKCLFILHLLFIHAFVTSVADPDPVFFGHLDPDPDPVIYRIRILYPQKDPMLFKFSRYKIV